MDGKDFWTIDTSSLEEIFDQQTPIASSKPDVSQFSSPGPVTDELIRSCVTPRKVEKVRSAIALESDRHKLAIRLLQHFFTKEELAMGNTEGNFSKLPLDRSRLNSLKGELTERSLLEKLLCLINSFHDILYNYIYM